MRHLSGHAWRTPSCVNLDTRDDGAVLPLCGTSSGCSTATTVANARHRVASTAAVDLTSALEAMRPRRHMVRWDDWTTRPCARVQSTHTGHTRHKRHCRCLQHNTPHSTPDGTGTTATALPAATLTPPSARGPQSQVAKNILYYVLAGGPGARGAATCRRGRWRGPTTGQGTAWRARPPCSPGTSAAAAAGGSPSLAQSTSRTAPAQHTPRRQPHSATTQDTIGAQKRGMGVLTTSARTGRSRAARDMSGHAAMPAAAAPTQVKISPCATQGATAALDHSTAAIDHTTVTPQRVVPGSWGGARQTTARR